ncbi:NAD(P)-binding protein [Atractiella rhizophila]|nr:NAD(P)-binding protein [Atractiella rhizophila]
MTSPKVFIVTGGANGIGAFITYHLATVLPQPMRIAVLDLDLDALKLFEERLTRSPPEGCPKLSADTFLFLQCDVSKEEEVRHSVEIISRQWGPGLDGLVNNAGIPFAYGYASEKTDFTDWTAEEFLRYQEVHVLGSFLLAKHCAPYLETRKGAIVNISSVRAHFSDPLQEGYAASKGGVSALTHALATSMGAKGLRVNCISPGYIDVSSGRQKSITRFPPAVDTPPAISLPYHFQMLTGRVGRGEDVAKLAWFLLDNEQSGFLTGQDICLDGGFTRRKQDEFPRDLQASLAGHVPK